MTPFRRQSGFKQAPNQRCDELKHSLNILQPRKDQDTKLKPKAF